MRSPSNSAFKSPRYRRPYHRIGSLLIAITCFLISSYQSSNGKATPQESLAPGVDYVQNEVIVTLTVGCMPTAVQSLSPPQFGVSALDVIVDELDGIVLIPAIVSGATQPSGFTRRMFLFRYSAAIDAQDAVAEFEGLSCVEYVGLNEIVPLRFYGTRRFVPDPSVTEFERQWHLDTLVTDDRIDIDAPEAWEIQRGAPGIVVGILDTGTMVDTSGVASAWRLHSDFYFFLIAGEDGSSPGILNGADFSCGPNFDDDNGDGVKDNIIGHNYTKPFGCTKDPPPALPCPNCEDLSYQTKAAFWQGIPHNWILEWDILSGGIGNPLSWDLDVDQPYSTHGVHVASLAAGQLEGSDLVGVGFDASIYVLRELYGTSFGNSAMITHAASVCDVINMSWGTNQRDLTPIRNAIQDAARLDDCVLVAATGNIDQTGVACGTPTSPPVDWPARYTDVLAVGAIGKDICLTKYSQWTTTAEDVDVVAPVDEAIWGNSHSLCYPQPCSMTENLKLDKGTSFAAPQAAGLAALIRARYPGLNQSDVRQRITQSAEFYWNKDDPVDRRKYGSGKINAYRALSEWGTLTTNTLWTMNTLPPMQQGGVWVTRPGVRNGTYYVSGDLTIESGATLTINPGVVVRIAPDHEQSGPDPTRVKITVKSGGVLNILGMPGPGNEVTFASFKEGAPAADDWVGIVFEPGSRGILKSIVIQNAITDVVVDEFNISVSDWDATKTLYLNSDYGVPSDLTIAADQSLFVLGNSDVIVTAGAPGNYVDITVDGSLIVKGTATQKPEFRSTTGAPSSWGVLTLTAASENNVFLNAVIRHAGAVQSYVPLTIDGCLFSGGTHGIQPYANLTVANSVFHDLSGYAVDVNSGSASFTKSTFADNGGAAIAAHGVASLAIDKCITAFNDGPAVRAVDWSGTASMANSLVFGNAVVPGSLTDAQWASTGQNVVNMNPAFCDAANGDYRLYAFSPASAPAAPYQGFFGERVGALDIGCVPPADVTASSSNPIVDKPHIVVACPQGDHHSLVIDVDLNGPITRNSIDRLEIVLDAADCVANVRVYDQSGFVEALGDAPSPHYVALISHRYFGGYGVNDVDVLLNGHPVGSQAHFDLRTMDVVPTGNVNILDFGAFGAHYTSPPNPYVSHLDFNDDGAINLGDFSTFANHYNHQQPGYPQLNPSSQVVESNAGVALQFTEEFPTANSHRLYVDISLENFSDVTTSVFSMRGGSDRLTLVEWLPNGGDLGEVLFAPVIRNDVEELFYGVLVSDPPTAATTRLGRLVFDVTGTDPMELTDDNFVLTVGDVLLEGAGEGPIAARMGGVFGRTFDPAVARIYHNRLEQNYPNPFNPTTTLAYSLKSASNVNLAIYDVAGRRVRELVKERRERGAYKIVWDGRNDNGVTVSSGVYFYKLVAGSFTDTKKMTILK